MVKGVINPASMDSDLEAFSHNPTDDSFAALAVQPTALPNIRTNGSSRTKLDYCQVNLFISRVKLTRRDPHDRGGEEEGKRYD